MDMTQQEHKLWMEARKAELKDLAAGVLGSQGKISLNRDHADVLLMINPSAVVEDLGAGSVSASCADLCAAVLEPAAPTTEEAVPTRRRRG